MGVQRKECDGVTGGVGVTVHGRSFKCFYLLILAADSSISIFVISSRSYNVSVDLFTPPWCFVIETLPS